VRCHSPSLPIDAMMVGAAATFHFESRPRLPLNVRQQGHGGRLVAPRDLAAPCVQHDRQIRRWTAGSKWTNVSGQSET
jgi:hypothetical protein